MRLRYFDLILAAFALALIISNIASSKIAHVDLGFTDAVFDGGTLLFPVTYIFGDVLTEVYGYAQARRAIWFGLGANVVGAATLGLVGVLPTDASSPTAGSYETVVGFVPQIVAASAAAFFIGEFLNSYILARLKVMTSGQFLWVRTIGSTIVGEAADTLTFSLLAFGIGSNALPSSTLWSLIAFNYIYKVGLEVVLTPATYAIVSFLKRAEGIDVYDRRTNFSPFRRASTSSIVG